MLGPRLLFHCLERSFAFYKLLINMFGLKSNFYRFEGNVKRPMKFYTSVLFSLPGMSFSQVLVIFQVQPRSQLIKSFLPLTHHRLPLALCTIFLLASTSIVTPSPAIVFIFVYIRLPHLHLSFLRMEKPQ